MYQRRKLDLVKRKGKKDAWGKYNNWKIMKKSHNIVILINVN